MKYTITLTREQLQTINMAAELYSRLCMGQINELRQIRKFGMNPGGIDNAVIKQALFPELQPNQYHCINSHEIPDDARTCFDLHQVIRHFLAWENEDNDPSTRKWPEQMQVFYDDPMKCGKEPFAKVEVVNG